MIKLNFKTLKGRNVIQNAVSKGADNNWKVLQQKNTVLFTNESGLWLKIVPLAKDGTMIMSLCRWVHAINDKDFKIQTI